MKGPVTSIRKVVVGMSRRTFLRNLFFVSLAVRFVFLFWNPADRKISLYEHGDIAHNLYTGNGFTMHWPYRPIDTARQQVYELPPAHEGAFLPPINPYLLTGFYLGFGENETSQLLYRILMCLVSAAVPVALYVLARKIAGEGVARFAAIIGAFNVFAAFGVATYSGSALYQLLAVVSIYTLLIVFERKKIYFYCLVGLLTALLTLLRSEYFMLGPVLIVISAFLFKERPRIRMQYVVVALVAHSVVIGPWVYRNYQLFDAFVPVLSHPWYEVWRGNNPRANGTTKDWNGGSIWVEPTHDEQIVRAMDSLPYDEHFEVRADSIFKTAVVEFWKDDPFHALKLGAGKIGMFMTSDFHGNVLVNIVYSVFSFLVFTASVVGIYTGLRRKQDLMLRAASVVFGLFLLYYLTLTFFTVMLPRYQIYALNTVLPIAAVGLSVVSKKLARNNE